MSDAKALAIIPQQLPAVAGETASTLVAAQSKATVEARYVIAVRNPREWDQVRQDVLKECRRPSFARNKSAFYRKPIGEGVEGLGIRFVEVALRCMKNVMVETTMIYEDDGKEIHRVTVTDLEANLTYPLDIKVSKTVERSKPSDDGTFISSRKNSYGKLSYTVPATDEDLLNKRAALISKAVRTLGLRIIPGDIQDEAEDLIKATRLNEAAKDPDAERKRIGDAFAELNITVKDLLDYLGHPLDKCTPAELVALRGTYGAIKDGEASWSQVMENKESAKKPAAETPITMPTAKTDNATVAKAPDKIAETNPPTPADLAPEPTGNGGGQSGDATDLAGSPVLDAGSSAPPVKPMFSPASDAQRTMITNACIKAGVSLDALDGLLIDKFAFVFDDMPADMVGSVLAFVKTKKAQASA